MDASSRYLMNGAFDEFLRIRLKNWASCFQAPDGGYVFLLQQIYLLFYKGRGDMEEWERIKHQDYK